MTRSDAEKIVAPLIQQIGQYQAVSLAAARQLLGDELFESLASDKVRGCGPTRETIYPWNVADYVQLKD